MKVSTKRIPKIYQRGGKNFQNDRYIKTIRIIYFYFLYNYGSYPPTRISKVWCEIFVWKIL